MPRTITLRGPIASIGPVLEVHVGVGATTKGVTKSPALHVKKRVKLRALIDTGAGKTFIVENTPFALGLKGVETFDVSGEDRPAYDIRVWWDATHGSDVIAIGGREPMYAGVGVLIGCDILSKGCLVVDGRTGTFALEIDCD